MNSFVGCTIADRAGLAQAVVAATSFLKFHPQARFIILLVDGPGKAPAVSGLSIIGLRDLELAPGEEWRLPMLYENRDLASVVKPVLLQTLLKAGPAPVAYFEYSTLILRSLTSAELPDDDRPVVATEPVKNDFGDSGRSFIAVRALAETALNVWLSRQPSDSSPPESAFDTVPHAIITASGFAVAYWNLEPNTLTASSNGYRISGKPLRSYDFRGYDPDKPHLLSKYQGLEPRILLSEYPVVAKLCDDYRQKVIAASDRSDVSQGDRPGRYLPSGLFIDDRMRRLYRQALDKWRLGEAPEPPSPFGPAGEEGFMKWLNEPIGQSQKQVTRYMLAVREDREDVRNAFPDPLGADAAGFRYWYLLFGRQELELSSALVPPDARRDAAADMGRVHRDFSTIPVNVAGYFRAELGLGVAARSLLSALEAADIPFNTISFDATANRQSNPFEDRAIGSARADINIVCVNPDQLPVFAERTGPELRHGRYTIGVWFWEVEDFPKAFHGAFNYVDEIWVASEFMRETFLKVSPKPVFKYLLPVLPPQIDSSLSRADLGLPDNFIFLFSFDLLSVLERKNPLGLIKAFITAFRDREGPVLVIKTINGDKRVLDMEKLRYGVRGRSDIILKDGYLSQIENNTFTGMADCYVSLHRSEGFGLTIAEAMALGKPTIGTAYSGNLEFMTAENSYLCPTRRCVVGPELDPYPADSHWSEPDIEAAAGLLRHVYDHQEEARARGLHAAQSMATSHAPAFAAPMIRERLTTVRQRRAQPSPQRSISFFQERVEELEAENSRLRAACDGRRSA